MKLEIEQPDENGWKGWIVLELTEDGQDVSISRDYQRPGAERKTWHDEGISLRVHDLPEVIEWLRAMVPSRLGEESK